MLAEQRTASRDEDDVTPLHTKLYRSLATISEPPNNWRPYENTQICKLFLDRR
jgi:hypothetical protein